MNAAKDRSDYQSEYYEKNKDKLADKAASRYKDDPEYRQRAIEVSRKHRAKKKKERDKIRAAGELPKRKPTTSKPVYVDIGGEQVLVHRIAVLAKRIGRSVDALNKWISNGSVPQTPFRTRRGDRLYTDGMILVVKFAVQAKGIVGHNKEVYDEIVNGWAELEIEA